MSETENNKIRIGEINNLQVLRDAPQGLYLGYEDGESILLPNKYVPESTHIYDYLDVFVYTDSEDRPIATTLIPQFNLNEIEVLTARDVNEIGAFMIWNIEKDIFVPFRNQKHKISKGNSYPIYYYIDNLTNRITGSAKIEKLLNLSPPTYTVEQEVDIIIYEKSPIGYKAIINKKHSGLVYKNEVFQSIEIGHQMKAYIKAIRPDNKIDLSLTKLGFDNINVFTTKILNTLQKNNGKLFLTDNSQPQEILETLQMSKKQFKKACGVLYKQKLIKLEVNHIQLIE
jgi:predicted RNA-binding protein (virulence factor B family)